MLQFRQPPLPFTLESARRAKHFIQYFTRTRDKSIRIKTFAKLLWTSSRYCVRDDMIGPFFLFFSFRFFSPFVWSPFYLAASEVRLVRFFLVSECLFSFLFALFGPSFQPDLIDDNKVCVCAFIACLLCKCSVICVSVCVCGVWVKSECER